MIRKPIRVLRALLELGFGETLHQNRQASGAFPLVFRLIIYGSLLWR